jgi:hypothetical protein
MRCHFFKEFFMSQKLRTDDPAKHPDPITKAPGSHPVGTGIGAAVGGAAGIVGAIGTGAALGSPAGPIGTAAGAAVGAVVGGLAGKEVAEEIDPTEEDHYWRENYASRPYVTSGNPYDEYGPAYQYGWESYNRHVGREFDEVESDLGRDWDRVKGKSKLKWEHAKRAARDAWDRVANRNDRE